MEMAEVRGAESTNLYTGFMALCIPLLKQGGDLIAITPRSYCNGLYFTPFRRELISSVSLKRFYLFGSREEAFSDDEVLQENVILHAIKGAADHSEVVITQSDTVDDDFVLERRVPYNKVVYPGDSNYFFHLVPDDLSQQVADRMKSLPCSLADLRLSVSTGRAVDFRAKQYLLKEPTSGAIPLIYPTHFENGRISWPKCDGKKANALLDAPYTQDLAVPNDTYVLVKRFSSKEEKKRIVAVVYDPASITTDVVAFENHLNYFHRNGRGLPPRLAQGLAAFLNSSVVDTHFRLFNGHTQVNATDIRTLRFPPEHVLLSIGTRIGSAQLTQGEIDEIIEIYIMDEDQGQMRNPRIINSRIEEAMDVLNALGFPRQQQNDRSALTLLALIDLTPSKKWSEATAVLKGITEMMNFFTEHYGRTYAPNTRETVRRQTVHQFLDAGVVLINPDNPTRPTNSGQTRYQVEQGALDLLRAYKTAKWAQELSTYLASRETLREKYAQERQMARIPISLAPGQTITLSPGGQNVLVQQVLTQFAERFAPGAIPLYVGDTDDKFAHFDSNGLHELGVDIEVHGKMPDVILYYKAKDWLILIEAVTSHGPIDPKRRQELKQLFANAKPGLVFVTAFLDRKGLVQYLKEISWETEVWVADDPSHLIHFDGERFLGPY